MLSAVKKHVLMKENIALCECFSVLTEGFIVSRNINLPIYLYSKKVNFRHLASN